MPLFDWKCDKHGVFECSDPICPAMGCESEKVEKIFLKAPGFKSDRSKNIDASTRKTADMHHLNDIRTPRVGEASYGGDKEKAYGKKVLWGNEVNEISKIPREALFANAAAPAHYVDQQGQQKVIPQGMFQAATELGITQPERLTPPIAEKTVSAKEQGMKKAISRANP